MYEPVRLNRNPPAPWIEQWEVPSHSRPNTAYIVSSKHDRENPGHLKWGCSCPAWTRGKYHHTDCKHIDEVLDIRRRNIADLARVTVDQPRIVPVDKLDRIDNMFSSFEF